MICNKILPPPFDRLELKHKGHGEYCGPCPYCYGTDRFIVWPERGQWGKAWCRQCGFRGDAIDLLRKLEGLTYKQAVERLGGIPAQKHALQGRGASSPPAGHIPRERNSRPQSVTPHCLRALGGRRVTRRGRNMRPRARALTVPSCLATCAKPVARAVPPHKRTGAGNASALPTRPLRSGEKACPLNGATVQNAYHPLSEIRKRSSPTNFFSLQCADIAGFFIAYLRFLKTFFHSRLTTPDHG